MDIAVDIKRDDLVRMQANIEDFAELRKTSIKEGVRWATLAVLKSLAKRTNTSKQRRKVRAPTDPKAKNVKFTSGNKIYVMETFKRGKPAKKLIYAPNLATAKKHPLTIIFNTGLARQSHGWAAQELFKTDLNARGPNRRRVKQPGGVMRTKKTEGANSYAIEVHNRVDYIVKALQGGNAALTDAVEAANKGMEFQISNNIFGKFGKRA